MFRQTWYVCHRSPNRIELVLDKTRHLKLELDKIRHGFRIVQQVPRNARVPALMPERRHRVVRPSVRTLAGGAGQGEKFKFYRRSRVGFGFGL